MNRATCSSIYQMEKYQSCIQQDWYFFEIWRFIIMNKIMWIIQDSDGKHLNWTELMKSLLIAGSKGIYCKLNNLKNINNSYFNIVIGGDDYLEEARKNKCLRLGVFDDDSFFSIDSYKKIWREDFLNFDVRNISINELNELKGQETFIRPILDNKCIDGGIYKIPDDYSKIKDKCIGEKCINYEKDCLCVGKIQPIDCEWRVVVIEEKIVSVCQYARNYITDINKDNIPKSLISFCEKMISNISSPIAWIIDIALVKNSYKILECNIFNASNFYQCDRLKIVKATEKAVYKKYYRN